MIKEVENTNTASILQSPQLKQLPQTKDWHIYLLWLRLGYRTAGGIIVPQTQREPLCRWLQRDEDEPLSNRWWVFTSAFVTLTVVKIKAL